MGSRPPNARQTGFDVMNCVFSQLRRNGFRRIVMLTFQRLRRLRKPTVHHFATDVRQTKVAALVAMRQLEVV